MEKLFFYVFWIFLFLAQHAFAGKFPLWGDLQPGPHGSGFTTKLTYDYSRLYRPKHSFDGKGFNGESARPVQIAIWYPAKKADGDVFLTFEDYVALIVQETDFSSLTPERKQQAREQYIRQRISFFNYNDGGLNELLKETTAAVGEADPQEGKFPLIIYAPGSGGSTFENTVLCEFLASHGYIVAAIPSMGTYSRPATVDLSGFYSYMEDIEYAIGFMQTYPNVDRDRLALIGFSMGGSAATLVQMRYPDIDAVVYLDTGIIFGIVENWFRGSHYYDKAALRAPQLYLTRSDAEGIDVNFLDSIPFADVYSVLVKQGYRHADFIADGIFVAAIPTLLPKQSTMDTKGLYESVNKYALEFFNAYVKNDAAGLKFLNNRPEENGVPAGLFNVEQKLARGAPPREWEFFNLIREQGVAKARAIFEKFQENSSNTQIFREAGLNALGYELLFTNQGEKALEVFVLNTLAYPKSANAQDSLSEAYERLGQKEKAIHHAEQALKFLAGDSTIEQRRREIIQTAANDRLKKLR